MAIEVWYVISRFGIGGTEKSLLNLVNNMDPNEIEPHVITFSSPNPLAEELCDHVHFRNISTRHRLSPLNIIKFLKSIHNQKPDIVQSFLHFGNGVVRLIYNVFSDVLTITGQRAVPQSNYSNVDYVNNSAINLTIDYIDRKTMNNSDIIVSNSKAGKNFLLKRGVKKDKVRVIHNGRNTNEFKPMNQCVVSTEFEKGPIIGTVGRLVRRKGHHHLINAWPRIKSEFSDAKLIIVGDGPEKDTLIELASGSGYHDSILFLGQRNDINLLLNSFDIFVFPSLYEGLPGALIEAMMTRLPIVCTNISGNSELIEHNRTGILVEPGNYSAIENSVTKLLNDDYLRNKIANAAYEEARRNYSISTTVENYLSLYKDLTYN